jgi:hypothetical protein
MRPVREHTGKLSGRVSEDRVLIGATEREVVVATGVRFIVNGATAGPLIIEEGASAEVNGTIVGPVTNHGRLDVNGLVLGAIRDVRDGKTDVRLNADEIRFHIAEPHPRAEDARHLNESLSDTTIEEDLVLNGRSRTLS